MSIRNLDAVLKPRSVALIGASARPRSIGGVVARNLLGGGFKGKIDLVSAHSRMVEGVACKRSVAALDEAPDLAVLAVPADAIPALVAELGARGTRGVVVLTASAEDAEPGSDARAVRQRILDAARPHLVRVLGPNCVGVLNPQTGLNASFAHVTPKPGSLAFVTQSGAVATSVLDWATPRGIGFSHVVSLGEMSDIDFGDLLDWLASDGTTRAILLHVETITSARKFMSAARIASRVKPVIVIKAGRHAATARAAESHTGALSGSDGVYDAAFRRAGMLRVRELSELFDAVETVSRFSGIGGERLAIVTNGGGLGIMATDSLIDLGGALAPLAPATVAALDAVLPRNWPHANPIDMSGDAGVERYDRTLEIVLAAPEIDATLVINCPNAIVDSQAAADATIAVARRHRMPVLTSWVGDGVQAEARRHFAAAGLPTFDTPTEAVRGFMHLVRHRRNRDALMQVPAAAMDETRIDEKRVESLLAAARAAGRSWLMAHEALELVAAYGIPTPRTTLAISPAKAAAIAARSESALALKLVSPDVIHKSDVGGVILNLSGAEAVRSAAETMLQRVARVAPGTRIEGFLVQEMVRRAHAHELIAGISTDPQFGPVLLFGAGGSAVEIVRDTALALPPINRLLARELMSRTRVYELLQGYRDTPPANLDAIADVLTRLAQLAADHAGLLELDINPLVADARGVIALDARIRIDPALTGRGDARFAIRPWPVELVERIDALDGGVLRPIRPEDASAIDAMFERLAPEDIRMRFFAPVRELPRPMLARLTQIDYDREMALVIEAAPGELTGVVRISCDPDDSEAEFAVLVRSDLKGKGRGKLLMERIIAYARGRGVGEIWGDILRENRGMIALARELDFVIEDVPEAREMVRARLKLG